MVKKTRVEIPDHIKDDLLVKCKHLCCRCENLGVQIHHIDEDPSNNDFDNLIPLCGHCHDIVHGKIPFTQSISQQQQKKYRDDHIEKYRKIPETIIEILEGSQELHQRVFKLEEALKNEGIKI